MFAQTLSMGKAHVLRLSAILIIAVSGSVSALSATPEPEEPQAGPCALAIQIAERARSIPVHLLQAISLTESGRWSDHHDAFIAWPWTVMAEGKGRYLPSKEAALAEVRALQARGVTNIDVGCMQVNLYYHGSNFSSLEEAFDPVHNVAYATAFLLDLRERRHSWTKAVQEYHSTDRERQQRYQTKVMTAWDALKKGKPIGGRETGITQPGYGYLESTSWPPRNYASQQRLEALARARAFSGYKNF